MGYYKFKNGLRWGNYFIIINNSKLIFINCFLGKSLEGFLVFFDYWFFVIVCVVKDGIFLENILYIIR